VRAGDTKKNKNQKWGHHRRVEAEEDEEKEEEEEHAEEHACGPHHPSMTETGMTNSTL
jgi:hypothetical protein